MNSFIVKHYKCLLSLCGADFFTTGVCANYCPTCNCEKFERLTDKKVAILQEFELELD